MTYSLQLSLSVILKSNKTCHTAGAQQLEPVSLIITETTVVQNRNSQDIRGKNDTVELPSCNFLSVEILFKGLFYNFTLSPSSDVSLYLLSLTTLLGNQRLMAQFGGYSGPLLLLFPEALVCHYDPFFSCSCLYREVKT